MDITQLNRPRPERYRLYFEPDLSSLSFSGRATLRFVGTVPSTTVHLDAVDLEVDACTVHRSSASQAAAWWQQDGILTVDLGEAEEPAEVEASKIPAWLEIEIGYHAELNEKMVGFYRSRYLGAVGDTDEAETRYVGITQFEERDARRAFPCIDEPWAKAVFDIAILAQAGHIAVSNTRELSVEERDDGARLYRFAPTPPMSTYLVAFAVGPFDMVTDESWRIPIRVVVSPGKAEQGVAALTYARQSLSYLEELVGIPYPLGKLDSIAVQDFAFGAMENFGAIVYREHLLLSKEGTTTRRDTERIMSVAAHEIAHMWFGDLVSPAAWRYVWLNEAFATYFGNVVTEHWYPEWRMIARFAADAMGTAMERDSLPGTVPIELEREEIEIDASTAPIVYNKGACVLGMVHGFYGDRPFRSAVEAFLRHFRFDAVDTAGFISVFGHALGSLEAQDVLESWIRTPGFPVLYVKSEPVEEADGLSASGSQVGGGSLRVRQEPFAYLGPTAQTAERPSAPRARQTAPRRSRSPGRWVIPVSAAIGSERPREDGEALRRLLRNAETRVDLPEASTWVKLNHDQQGYYRVFYEDPQAWERLGAAAADGELSALDRQGLLADLAAFAWASEDTAAGAAVDLHRFLDFASRYYARESDPVVLGELAVKLTGFHSLLPEHPELRRTAFGLLRPHRDTVLEEPSDGNEPYATTVLRDPVLSALIAFEDDVALDRLRGRARRLMEGDAPSADLILPTLRGAVRADPAFAEWIMERLSEAQLFEASRIQYLRSLATLHDEPTVGRVLRDFPRIVPSRNWACFFQPAGTNPSLAPHLWRWFQERVDTVADLHMHHASQLITAIVPVGALGSEKEALELLEARVLPVDTAVKALPVDRDVVNLALDRLEVNRRFVEREGAR